MSIAHDFALTARWGLKMTSMGPEGLINELPLAWRRAGYAALLAVSMTAGYFMLVQSPIADAKDAVRHNKDDITQLQQDVSGIKGDLTTVKANQAAQAQKLDDVRDSVNSMNQKIDRLLMRGQQAGHFP